MIEAYVFWVQQVNKLIMRDHDKALTDENQNVFKTWKSFEKFIEFADLNEKLLILSF